MATNGPQLSFRKLTDDEYFELTGETVEEMDNRHTNELAKRNGLSFIDYLKYLKNKGINLPSYQEHYLKKYPY